MSLEGLVVFSDAPRVRLTGVALDLLGSAGSQGCYTTPRGTTNLTVAPLATGTLTHSTRSESVSDYEPGQENMVIVVLGHWWAIKGHHKENVMEGVAMVALKTITKLSFALSLFFLIFLSACGSLKWTANHPLPDNWERVNKEAKIYDFPKWIDRRAKVGPLDDTFIIMSMSGGGVRATALAYAVVDELRKFRTASGRELAQNIGLVSSTSGGSVTAAQIGLFGVDSMDEQGEQQKKSGAEGSLKQFLYAHNTRRLIGNLINPFGDAFILNPLVNRATGLQNHLSRSLFGEITFRDVGRNGAPFVVFNGSDMGSGRVFPFTQDRFSDFCSNLNELPVAAAVTASAAFPFALQPIGFANHSTDAACRHRRGFKLDSFRRQFENPHYDAEAYQEAIFRNDLRLDAMDTEDPYEQKLFRPSKNVSYLWILDGGLSDNLGAVSLLKNVGYPELRKLKQHGVNNLIYIEINARSEQDAYLNTSPLTPNYIQVARSVTGNPIDNTTSTTAALAQIQLQQRFNGVYKNPNFFPVQVRFDLLSDPEMAKDVRNIRTWWSLPNDQINHVIAAGRRLLKDDPCFRKFIAQSRVHSMNEQLQPWTPGTCRADSADSNGLPESSSASLNGRRRENPSAR